MVKRNVISSSISFSYQTKNETQTTKIVTLTMYHEKAKKEDLKKIADIKAIFNNKINDLILCEKEPRFRLNQGKYEETYNQIEKLRNYKFEDDVETFSRFTCIRKDKIFRVTGKQIILMICCFYTVLESVNNIVKQIIYSFYEYQYNQIATIIDIHFDKEQDVDMQRALYKY